MKNSWFDLGLPYVSVFMKTNNMFDTFHSGFLTLQPKNLLDLRPALMQLTTQIWWFAFKVSQPVGSLFFLGQDIEPHMAYI